MNPIGCELAGLLRWLVQIYMVLLFAYAILSWLPDLRGKWTDYLARGIEPVLMPVRRVIPPIGGLDIAFLVVFLFLQFGVMRLIDMFAVSACYSAY